MKRLSVFLVTVLIAIMTCSSLALLKTPSNVIQKIDHNKLYTCDGDTIQVGRCRHESDDPESFPTKPEDDWCMVYYPKRPLQGGFTVQKTELFGDLLKRLQACGALASTSATSQPARTGMSGQTNAKSIKADADRYLTAKDYSRALDAYQRTISLDPSLEDAYYGVAAAAGALGDGKTRMAALQRLNVIKPHNYDVLFAIGAFGIKDQMYKEALTALLEACRLKPDSALARSQLGMAYSGLSQTPEAIAAFKEAMRIDPKFARAHAHLGNMYVFLGRNLEAVPELKEAIRLEPTYASGYKGLGMAYARMGRKAEAIKVYKQLQTIDKQQAQELYEEINQPSGQQSTNNGNASGRSTNSAPSRPTASPNGVKSSSPVSSNSSSGVVLAQANVLYTEKKYAAAIEAYKKTLTIKLHPEILAQVHLNMGSSYFSLKDYPNSILHFRESLRLYPNAPGTHFSLGFVYYKNKQFPEALASFQEAVRLKATNPEAQYWVGESYLALKQGDKAIPFLRESLRLRPNDARTLGELGAAYYFNNDYEAAIEAYTQAIRNKPNDPNLYYGLGKTYLVLGRKTDALRVYHTLETLDPKKAKELYDQISQ